MSRFDVPVQAFSGQTLSTTKAHSDVHDLGRVVDDIAVQWSVGYSPGDDFELDLEGSLDGVNWYFVSQYQPGAETSTSHTSVIFRTTDTPVRYVRCRGGATIGAPVVDSTFVVSE